MARIPGIVRREQDPFTVGAEQLVDLAAELRSHGLELDADRCSQIAEALEAYVRAWRYEAASLRAGKVAIWLKRFENDVEALGGTLAEAEPSWPVLSDELRRLNLPIDLDTARRLVAWASLAAQNARGRLPPDKGGGDLPGFASLIGQLAQIYEGVAGKPMKVWKDQTDPGDGPSPYRGRGIPFLLTVAQLLPSEISRPQTPSAAYEAIRNWRQGPGRGRRGRNRTARKSGCTP